MLMLRRQTGVKDGAPRSLRRNFSSALSGNTVYAACQFGMVSILAHVTSPTEVGRYALALAISGPVFILASLRLQHIQITDASQRYRLGDYLAQRIMSSLLATTAVIVVGIVISLPGRTYITLVGVALFKGAESIIDILYGAMTRQEQMHLVARSQAWRGVGGLVVFSGAIVATDRVDYATIALALYTCPQIATNSWRARKLGIATRPSFNRAVLLNITWLALPLGLSYFVGALTVNVPRYFVEAYDGTAALGVYASLAYVVVITNTVVDSLGQAASPRLANLYSSGEALRFRRILWRMLALAAGLGFVGVLGSVFAGQVALRLVFGPEYASEVAVLILLMIAAAAQYWASYIRTALNAMRIYKAPLPISLANFGCVALVSILAVPKIGLVGAAVAILIGQVVAALMYSVLLFRVILPRLRIAKLAASK